MFDSLRRFLGLIKVTEQGDYVLVSGLPADFINFTINRIWSTSKIATNMFNRITNSQIVFHRFFVPDVIYTLQVVMNDKRSRSYVNVIEKVIDELYANTWAKSILEDPEPFLDRSKLDLFKKKPLPHQSDFFDVYESNTQRYKLKGFLLGAVPGSGKAHPLDVKLRTPTGYILMKDVQVGDILLDRFFRPTVVTGVFPQGKKDIYKITFEDGRTTRCCLEHFWKTYVNDHEDVIETSEIYSYLKQGIKVYIDLPRKLSIVSDKVTYAKYDKKQDLVKSGIEHYRSYGALVHRNEENDHYNLEIQFKASHKIEITSIEYDSNELAQCIQVDNDEHLYLVDDFIVTHNTIASMMLSRMLNTDTNIFLVPKNSLDKVWKASFDTEFSKKIPNYWISNSGKPIDLGYSDYIIHHDHISKVLDFFNKYNKEFGSTYVNVDESHFFNEIKSNRTQYVVDLAKNILESQNTVFMSGTPIKAVGSEAIPLLRIIDPFFHEKVEERFLKIYGKSQSRANDILQNRMGTLTFKVEKATAVGNDVTLNQGYVSIPNGKDYTLKNIRGEMKKFITERLAYYKNERSGFDKEYLRIIEYYKKNHLGGILDREAKREFEQYQKAVELIRNKYDPVARKDDIILANKYERYKIIPNLSPEDKKIFRDVKSVYKYYFLKVQGEALGRVLGRLRVQCNVDMLQGLDNIVLKDAKGKVTGETSIEKEIFSTKKKTLIFTSFVEVVQAAKSYLEEKGFKPLVVYGETNKELASIVSRFASDENANPLIATYKSLSTAVPLTMANVTVMLNAPFRDYEFQQALSRTDRVGQDSPVYCTTVYLDTDNEPNISTRSKDIMEWSKQQIEEILGFKVDNDQVSLEDEDSKDKDHDPVKSLAEKLDVGVDTITGDDSGINPNGTNEIVETDKGKLRVKYWNSW